MSCDTNQKNPTTLANCQLGLLSQFALIRKSKFFSTFTLAMVKANWDALVYSGDMFILPTLLSVESADEETVYQKTDLKEVFVRGGQMSIKGAIDGSLDLHTKLRSLSSSGEWAVILLFEDENVAIGYNPLGTEEFRGLDVDTIQFEKYKRGTGSEIGQTPFRIAFKDATQFNDNPGVVMPDNAIAPWSVNSLESLRTIELGIVSATATKITFRAFDSNLGVKSGVKIPLLGLVAGDFILAKTDLSLQTITTLTATTAIDGTPQYEAAGTGLVTGTLTFKTPTLMTTKGYSIKAPVAVTIA